MYYRRYVMRDFYSATPATPKAVVRALKMSKVQGHYYEFGLYKGYSFYQAVKNSPSIMHFGFDSFQGLPETIEGGKFVEGKYSSSLEEVTSQLEKRGCLEGNVKLVKGFFDNSLTKELQNSLLENKIKVVLIDVDLYKSTVPVLNFIKPMLQQGTIILFDDWNCFDADDNKGERKAFKEFLQLNRDIKFKESFAFGWHGQAFELTSV